MRQITLPSGSDIEYPVGHFLTENMPIIREMAECLREELTTEEVNLWCSGSSGAIIASIIVTMLPEYTFTICHVKKVNEDAHSKRISWKKKGTNVIVDDFIVTGETINYILQHIYTLEAVPHILCLSGDFYKKRHEDLFYNFNTVIVGRFL